MRRHGGLKQKLITGIVLSFALLSTVQALAHDETRGPVVKFIDFYIASQKADVPRMSLWERVIYGLAIAKTPDRVNPQASCR